MATRVRTDPGHAGPIERRLALRAIRSHRLTAFYGLAFALSWGYWLADVIVGRGTWSHAPGLLGPMISALIVTGIALGRPGLHDLARRLVRWRVPLRWYVCVAAPTIIAVGTAAIWSIGGQPFPAFGDWTEMRGFGGIPGWAALAVIILVNGYGEETGWRGFATPTLRRHHDLVATSLFVAMPWALWHTPLFFIDSGFAGFPVAALPGWLIGAVAVSVVLTWVYEGARASILIAALMHVSLNVATATTATEGVVGGIVTAVVIVGSIQVARRSHGTGGRPHHAALRGGDRSVLGIEERHGSADE
jgi:uncharacterized protein